ncbi:MAG: glycosyltransferase family 39 protein [Elusimicrobiales bacterium]|nr:glycosyltransferase family 39 protein [Elusimicrobiales bacterium]
MKRKIFLGVLLIIFTALTTKLSYDFLIEWSQDTGLFFIPVLCFSALDPIFNTNILWKMPLSQFIHSIFNIFPLKYLSFIVFSIFLVYYSISSAIIFETSKSLRSQILFFFLSIIYIYFFKYSFDIEQVAYTLCLIIFGYFFYVKEKENNLKNIISCSLILGFSFLIKTNLIILPPLLAIYEYIKTKNLKKH